MLDFIIELYPDVLCICFYIGLYCAFVIYFAPMAEGVVAWTKKRVSGRGLENFQENQITNTTAYHTTIQNQRNQY